MLKNLIFVVGRSALVRHLLWRRGCLCVCHVSVLYPNDCVDHYATFYGLQPSYSSFPISNIMNPIAGENPSHWGHQMGEG